jgi:hypothetical protein
VLETHYCKELDFTNNVVMSHKDVAALQSPFREDDVKADYSKTATTKALVVRRAPPNEPRDRDQEHEDAQAINRLREVQAPAVKLLKLIAKQPTLHTLRIDCKNLGEEAFCCLASSLEENTSLRILDCSRNHLTPHAAGLLGFSLRNHPLEELYLDFCTVGLSLSLPPLPPPLSPPPSCFPRSAHTEYMHTHARTRARAHAHTNTHTHTDGAYHFANSIYGNSALRVLSLRGNNIGPDFPKSLLWLLTPLPVSQVSCLSRARVLSLSLARARARSLSRSLARLVTPHSTAHTYSYTNTRTSLTSATLPSTTRPRSQYYLLAFVHTHCSPPPPAPPPPPPLRIPFPRVEDHTQKKTRTGQR